jgi:hypothetical protein
MANKGKFTATSASTEVIAADPFRDIITIQKANATAIAFGLGGETAITDEGISLDAAGEVLQIIGPMARMEINAIGNNGTATWQSGDISVT